jgi:hypothetical protein
MARASPVVEVKATENTAAPTARQPNLPLYAYRRAKPLPYHPPLAQATLRPPQRRPSIEKRPRCRIGQSRKTHARRSTPARRPVVIPRKGGKYGGTMRMATTDKDPFTGHRATGHAGYSHGQSEDLSGVVPNLLRIANTRTTKSHPLHHAQGSKFSNGMEHTADDRVFWRDIFRMTARQHASSATIRPAAS